MITTDFGPRSPYGEALPSEQLIAEVCDVRAEQVSAGVQIGYTLLNRHLLGKEPAIVSIGAFMSSLTAPDRAWEGVQLAALGRPVLSLDLPGHGLSSPHNFRQTMDLCVKRSADSEARPLTDAVQRLLPPDDPIDYFGISHSALMSLKATEQDPGDRVRTVFGMDLPAVKRRATLGMQAGYILQDGLINRKQVLAALADTNQGRDFESFKQYYVGLGMPQAPDFVHTNTGLAVLNLFASVNARPVALESWRRVMEQKSADVEVVTSERGQTTDHKAIGAFIGSLTVGQQERSRQRVVKDEDHNMCIVHLMPRAVAWAEAAYEETNSGRG